MTDGLIQQAAELVANSQEIAVLTGAGVSKESGVPTFRDALETQKVCDAVLGSARTGQWVEIPSA